MPERTFAQIESIGDSVPQSVPQVPINTVIDGALVTGIGATAIAIYSAYGRIKGVVHSLIEVKDDLKNRIADLRKEIASTKEKVIPPKTSGRIQPIAPRSFFALRDTQLKRSKADSTVLPDESKFKVSKGAEVVIDGLFDAGDHWLVRPIQDVGEWYLFKQHWGDSRSLEDLPTPPSSTSTPTTSAPTSSDRSTKLFDGEYGITSPYGMRTHPVYRDRRMHTGVDYATPSGTQLYSPISGKVTLAQTFSGFGYGVQIQGQEPEGFTSIFFAHISKFLVKAGDAIKSGEAIALSGGALGDPGAGTSTGAHLHFEVKVNNKYVDPVVWMQSREQGADTVSPAADEDNTKAWETAYAFSLEAEGGDSSDRNDPAVAFLLAGETVHTSRGVTQYTYNAYRRSLGQDIQPVRLMSKQEKDDIYYRRFWLAAKCELMAPRLAISHFDAAVNFGVAGAIKHLQIALGIPDDGAWGSVTERSLFSADGDLVFIYNALRRDFYENHPQIDEFPGWLNRMDDLEALLKEY